MADKKLIALVQRHGETDTNKENLFRSRLDPALNDKGLSQAEQAAKAIAAEHKPDRIISSPLLRAVQTADIIAEALSGPAVEQDRGLLCWNLGFLSGKDKDTYAYILDFFIDNPKKPVPEGESLDDLETRSFEFFEKEFKHEGLTLFVTHTSNIITLENLINGNHDGRPEAGETSVEPGGTIGVYVDDSGKYSTDVLFGKEKEAVFGS